jgi:hypothetical protein
MGEEVDQLLAEVRRGGGIRARVGTLRAQAVRAMRLLEARLVDALAGDSLRGLVNLVPPERGRFVAANVRGSAPYGIDRYLPFGNLGGETLCIGRHGDLLMASTASVQGGLVREATDEDLRFEDLELMVLAVREVLRRHLAAMPAHERRCDRVRRVAECVEEALGRVA